MKNAFTQTRKWMMAKYDLSEIETWTIITQAVNFGMTQLVDGNWGMHALIPKSIFEGVERNAACAAVEEPIEEPVEEAPVEEDDMKDEYDHDHDDHDHDHDDEKDSGVGYNGLNLPLVLSLGLLFVTIFN